jgi:hypothetical protein
VTQRIRTALVSASASTVVCSAACGADIIALEVAGELGLRRRIILPFGQALFREISVTDRNGGWGSRFDLLMQSAVASGDVVELGLFKDDPNVFAAANEAILNEAAHEASAAGLRTMAMVAWDGVPRGGNDITKAFLNEAQRRKLEVLAVSTL